MCVICLFDSTKGLRPPLSLDTTENMKKIVFVSGQGETTWGYGFYQKKVILDKSQCCGGLVLDWVPLTAQ